jgi:hypothetical protein
MDKLYAGIGSRNTPQEELYILRDAASYLATKGYTLRSGGAEGADNWCEKGCDLKQGKKEIYLPWRNFNFNESNLFSDNLPKFNDARVIAKQYHPSWKFLSETVRRLMARNAMQICGKNLDTPVDFVLCYCPIKNGELFGGTAQALRHALDLDIPIINIFLEEDRIKITKKIYTK